MKKSPIPHFCISLFCFLVLSCGPRTLYPVEVVQGNKPVPAHILGATKKALAYFPELQEVPISFRYRDDLKNSHMQARPDLTDLFRRKEKRSYSIYISRKLFTPEREGDPIPEQVLVGWLGHELGHIIDYGDRSNIGMMIFGLRYLTSRAYLRQAENRADSIAVVAGMSEFLLATRLYIRNSPRFSDDYKERITRLYPSQAHIIQLEGQVQPIKGDSEAGH